MITTQDHLDYIAAERVRIRQERAIWFCILSEVHLKLLQRREKEISLHAEGNLDETIAYCS